MSNIVILPTEEIKEALKGQDFEDLIAQPITVIFGGVHINYLVSQISHGRHSPPEYCHPHPLDGSPTFIELELEPCSQQVVEVRK